METVQVPEDTVDAANGEPVRHEVAEESFIIPSVRLDSSNNNQSINFRIEETCSEEHTVVSVWRSPLLGV